MIAMPKKRVQIIERLRKLPPVFTVNTASAIMGCEAGMTSTYIKRWKDTGLVSSLGNKSGVHFNLLADPNGVATRRMEAIKEVYPGAVLSGASALHLAGWTTQIPTSDHIIIPARRSWPEVEGVDVSLRDPEWFGLAKDAMKKGQHFPSLHPAFALADSVKSGSWIPDSDDIEWDQVHPLILMSAFKKLEVDMPKSWAKDLSDIRPD
jgi:predicted transcriptional regulator of viral defense system